MNSRAYNKRIEIYESVATPNGFGGNSITPSLIGESWAKISTFNVGRNTNELSNGLIDVNDSLIITVRKRNDITYNSQTQFIKYRGEKYIITTSPVNVGFEDREIQFIVKKASSTVVNG